jgi:hypothetical protein
MISPITAPFTISRRNVMDNSSRRRVMDNSSRRRVMAHSSHLMTTINVLTVDCLWIQWSSSVFFCRPFLWQMCQHNRRLSIRRLISWRQFIKCLLLLLPMFSTWVLLPTTLMLLPLLTLLLLPTLLPTHDALYSRTPPEIALPFFLCQLKICSMIFMSNFSHEIFQSGLSLPLSESHNN